SLLPINGERSLRTSRRRDTFLAMTGNVPRDDGRSPFGPFFFCGKKSNTIFITFASNIKLETSWLYSVELLVYLTLANLLYLTAYQMRRRRQRTSLFVR